jgi:hypothetical protein
MSRRIWKLKSDAGAAASEVSMVLRMIPANTAMLVVRLVETERRPTHVEDPDVKSRA